MAQPALDLALPAYRFPAPVTRAPQGDDTDRLLALARERHALDPTVFDQHAPFFLRAEISNGAVDAYYTRMGRTTLANYAADAAAGVSFLIGHNTRMQPVGRSLTGVLEADADGRERVISDAFVLAGLSADADALITGLRAGIGRDVSVGFYGGKYLCDICHRDLFWSDCPHLPGLEYNVLNEEGHPTGERVVATAAIEDAHLSEYSSVYDGATPGASVLKAHRQREAGALDPKIARLIEQRYRHLDLGWTNRHVWDGWTPPATSQTNPPAVQPDMQEVSMDPTREPTTEPTEQRSAPAPGTREDVVAAVLTAQRETLTRLNAPEAVLGGPTADAFRWLGDEIVRLRPLADAGTAYRADLIESAIAEGVRALGAEKFGAEVWKARLAGMDLDLIKSLRDQWAETAALRLPGGRLTVDRPEAGSTTASTPEVPADAYKG